MPDFKPIGVRPHVSLDPTAISSINSIRGHLAMRGLRSSASAAIRWALITTAARLVTARD
jgi:hypothetical protein